MLKYAIKVPFEDDHLLVIDYERFTFEGPDYPKLYDSYDQAFNAARGFKTFEIVEYDEKNN